METKRRRMAGIYYVKPYEVHDKLKKLGRGYNEFYDDMIRNAIISEDWEADSIWVTGRFRASRSQMIQWADMSRSTFQRRWANLTEEKLIIENEDGSFSLPMYKKKEDEGITVTELKVMGQGIKEMGQQLAHVMILLQNLRQEEKGAISDEKSQKPVKTLQNCVKTLQKPVKTLQKSVIFDTRDPFKEEEKDKDSLSCSNTISGFYRGIGQEKISKQKRERANTIFKKLRKDGFTPEDIAFAVEWTLENAKEQLYDFSIIEHTVGQAIAARQKAEGEAKEIEDRERVAAEEEEGRVREEKQREEIESYKESMDPEQREALRRRAETELRESGQFKEEYITDLLIEVKENEILRKKLIEQNNAGSEGENE